ncbi:hypothetical protein [Baaleninema simplex]|uniref:hypothetical protein n=1 Tax=Baaleninema simplex TaxID=2862350 RepID=UPI001181B25A|nr:hypothetical protein [Baaleninema simplex]
MLEKREAKGLIQKFVRRSPVGKRLTRVIVSARFSHGDGAEGRSNSPLFLKTGGSFLTDFAIASQPMECS